MKSHMEGCDSGSVHTVTTPLANEHDVTQEVHLLKGLQISEDALPLTDQKTRQKPGFLVGQVRNQSLADCIKLSKRASVTLNQRLASRLQFE